MPNGSNVAARRYCGKLMPVSSATRSAMMSKPAEEYSRRSPGAFSGLREANPTPPACDSKWRTVAPGGSSSSSSSNTPSSTATSIACADSSLVTLARPYTRESSPWTTHRPSAPRAAAHTDFTGHSSTEASWLDRARESSVMPPG